MTYPVIFRSELGNVYVYDYLANSILHLSERDALTLRKMMRVGTSPRGNPRRQTKHTNYVDNSSLLKNALAKYAFRGQSNETKTKEPWFGRVEFNQNIANCSNLILNITDFCNFSCEYCYYESALDDRAPRIRREMPFSIARKAIRYYFNLSQSRYRISRFGRKTIGFYGGEPVLKFDFIKQCVKFARSLCFQDDLRFNLTTNGSLLNEENIKYFIDNNFHLLISLDGPETEHDRCRIDYNGVGTFSRVWRNLGLLRRINQRYFANNVRFNSVYTELHNLAAIDSFFEQGFLKRNHVLASKASGLEYCKGRLKTARNERLKIFKEEFSELHKEFVSIIVKKKPMHKYLKALFYRYYSPLVNRKYVSCNAEPRPPGTTQSLPCFPGSVRLYVTTDGQYHICERINNCFPIGNCDDGIEYESVLNVINKFHKQKGEQCFSCEAKHICQACYATFSKKDKFEGEAYCEKIKRSLPDLLSEYVSIMEKGPGLFDRI